MTNVAIYYNSFPSLHDLEPICLMLTSPVGVNPRHQRIWQSLCVMLVEFVILCGLYFTCKIGLFNSGELVVWFHKFQIWFCNRLVAYFVLLVIYSLILAYLNLNWQGSNFCICISSLSSQSLSKVHKRFLSEFLDFFLNLDLRKYASKRLDTGSISDIKSTSSR